MDRSGGRGGKEWSGGVPATFLIEDALTLKDWSERFDDVIDGGCFHGFSDEDRRRYVEGLTTALRPGGRLFLLCFSDDEPGAQGPRRVSKDELQAAFAEGWRIESVEQGEKLIRASDERGTADALTVAEMMLKSLAAGD